LVTGLVPPYIAMHVRSIFPFLRQFHSLKLNFARSQQGYLETLVHNRGLPKLNAGSEQPS